MTTGFVSGFLYADRLDDEFLLGLGCQLGPYDYDLEAFIDCKVSQAALDWLKTRQGIIFFAPKNVE